MERDSFAYKARRKLQVAAQKVLPDTLLSKLYFRLVLKKKCDLKNPKTFNEKLQWLKLYSFPFDDLVIRCADKFAVRDYIKEKGFENILVPLLGAWERPEDIDWERLPDAFVLKCNHGCAYNILCPDKKDFDISDAKIKLRSWLKEDFGAFNIEPHYSKIKEKKIVCEQFLGDCITDYKFFCFHGKVKYLYVSSDLIHDRQAQIGFFYPDGSKMPLSRDDYADIDSIELPAFFEEMKKTAEKLAEDFPFVRVDFFLSGGTYYFAELTFTPGACMMPFSPESFDLEWGNQLDLKKAGKKNG